MRLQRTTLLDGGKWCVTCRYIISFLNFECVCNIYRHFSIKNFRWCSDSRVGPLVTGAGSEGCVRSWTRINQLVSLPHDYSELINTVSQFPCPASSGDDSRTPTMCLVCGKMLCSQVS